MSQNFYKIHNGLNLGSQASDPSSPNEGDFYTNSVSSKVRVYLNGAWRDSVTADAVDLLSNKKLEDSTTSIVDSSDNTKTIKFDAAGTTGTSTTLLSSQTADRVLTLPDATDVLVAKDTSLLLKNKTLEDTTTAIVDSADNTKQIKFDAAGSTSTSTTILSSQTANRTLTLPDATTSVVGTDVTQTLSAKTFSDSVTVAEVATPSTPASGFGRFYFKADGKAYSLNDSGDEVDLGGSGQGGINYIDNYNAELDVAGWVAYADAAGVAPVDGTGGSPTVTITRTTSTPLRGLGSFLITKDAANRQGEGVSYDFTIDEADKGNAIKVSFDYNLASGTFVSGTSSDIRMYIYDVTNSTVISVFPNYIDGVSGSNWHFLANFVAASNSTSYRLIFHVATTSASAYTFKFDNVIVGPAEVVVSAPTTTIYNAGASGTYNSPGAVSWTRVRMIGGGGGGGGSGTGSPGTGGDGGDTTFGALTAGKGFGGPPCPGPAAGGAGGTATGGNVLNIIGQDGTWVTQGASNTIMSGGGASSHWGTGGPSSKPNQGGYNGVGYGSGGGGSGDPAGVTVGGTGGGSAGYVEHIYNTPISVSYSVGSGGSSGTAGTSGYGGGTGAPGRIVIEEYYTPFTVELAAQNHEVFVYGGNGNGSTNTAIRRYSTTGVNTGSAITYADSATAGASFTINSDGIYAMTITDDDGGAFSFGISRNSTQLSTSIYSISVDDFLCATHTPGNAPMSVSMTKRLVAGDVIRPHDDNTSSVSGGNVNTNFRICKIAS